MRVWVTFLNTVGFVVGAVLLLLGVVHEPQIMWMIVVGTILLLITAGVFLYAKRDDDSNDGGSGSGSGLEPSWLGKIIDAIFG